MSHTHEICILEKNLSIVMGRPVKLRSPEVTRLTPDNLKHAYYRMAHECHPDKARHLGLDQTYLTNRFQSLQNAYSSILESFDSGAFSRFISEPEPEPELRRPEPAECKPVHPACRTASPGPQPSGHQRMSIYHNGNIPAHRLRFAQYLYYSKRIDWDTLIRSLSWQLHNRPRLGDLAMRLEYLTHADVCTILRHKQLSELFGETAVRLGYLSPSKLSILMGRQSLMNLPIGRFFVENGYLDRDELEGCLDSLRKHNFLVRARCRAG